MRADGTADVLDLQTERVNRESLKNGELDLLPLDGVDREIVADLLTEHQRLTGSQLAARLIADLDATLERFTKVLPHDYAAVLETRAHALAEGLDPDGEEVWARILEVTRG